MISPWTIYKQKRGSSPNVKENKMISQQVSIRKRLIQLNQADQFYTVGLNRQVDQYQMQSSKKSIQREALQNILDNEQSSTQLIATPFYEKTPPNYKRKFSKQKLIQKQQGQIIDDLNSLAFLRSIKKTLSQQNLLEKNYDSGICKIIEKLNPEKFRKISPQQKLLDQLIRNEIEKMQRKQQKQQKNQNLQGLQNYSGKKIGNTINEYDAKTRQDLINLLKCNIERSSIIKYAKYNFQSKTYLKGVEHYQLSNQQELNIEETMNNKFSLNTQQSKVIYIGQKPNFENLNSLRHQISNFNRIQKSTRIKAKSKSKSNHYRDKSFENSLPKISSNKNLVHQLIKKHFVSKEQIKSHKILQLTPKQKTTIEQIKQKRKNRQNSTNQDEFKQKGVVNSQFKNLKKSKSVNHGHEENTPYNKVKRSLLLDRSSPLLIPGNYDTIDQYKSNKKHRNQSKILKNYSQIQHQPYLSPNYQLIKKESISKESYLNEFLSFEDYDQGLRRRKQKIIPIQALESLSYPAIHQNQYLDHKKLHQHSLPPIQMGKSQMKFGDHKIFSPSKQKSLSRNKFN